MNSDQPSYVPPINSLGKISEVSVLDDFNSIQMTVEIDNLTTGMAFKKRPNSQLCEFAEGRYVLEVPERNCAIGHHLMIFLSMQVPGEVRPASRKHAVSVTARVVAIEPAAEGVERLLVALLQFDRRQLDELFGVIQERQKAISLFLSAARGVDVET